jgi:hypothetical protein
MFLRSIDTSWSTFEEQIRTSNTADIQILRQLHDSYLDSICSQLLFSSKLIAPLSAIKRILQLCIDLRFLYVNVIAKWLDTNESMYIEMMYEDESDNELNEFEVSDRNSSRSREYYNWLHELKQIAINKMMNIRHELISNVRFLLVILQKVNQSKLQFDFYLIVQCLFIYCFVFSCV